MGEGNHTEINKRQKQLIYEELIKLNINGWRDIS